jgi:O-antigen/teichoic acid export membrane protein
MAAGTIREIRAGAWDAPEGRPVPLRYTDILSFYYPLALTSLIGLSVQPLLTFFMGNSVRPVQSLAVFPVVHALGFFFRSMGLAYQDAAIALMGDRLERLPEVKRFAVSLGAATSAALGLVAFTPLSEVWFMGISGLPRELAAFASTPTALLVPLPALSVLLSLQRAILVQNRRTRPITVASAVEVGAVAVGFVTLGWGIGLVGATAAFGAFLLGRTAGNLYLFAACRRVRRRAS